MSHTTLIKPFLKYTSLNVLGMLGISCYILADTFFIANGIGADGLAALNLAIPIYSFIHGTALMLGIGAATKFTIAKTQGEHLRADFIFTNSLYSAAILSVLFVTIGLFFSKQIATLLKADTALFEMTNTYLKVILLFSPFFICNELLLSFVRNDGAPSLAMSAMISGSIANIILDYIFIYPFQMGIFGAVLATGIAPIISILLLSIHKLRNHNHFHLSPCPLCMSSILDNIILGFPSFITEVSAGIVMIVFNILILELAGNVGIAAYGIIANIALVTSAIYTGIAQGSQPLLSTAFGANEHHTLKAYLKYSIIFSIIISVIIYSIIFFFNSQITLLFNNENNIQLQTIAESGLILYFTSIPFVGLNIILSMYFTSTETPMPAHIISLLRGLIIVVPMAFLLSAHSGMTGLWLTITVTELITTLIGLLLWHKCKPII